MDDAKKREQEEQEKKRREEEEEASQTGVHITNTGGISIGPNNGLGFDITTGHPTINIGGFGIDL